MWSRREVLQLGALGTLTALATPALAKDSVKLITRPIPSTGEQLPAIGLGSYQTFDVTDASKVRPVLARFLELGGRVVDSSPMYGRAEAAIGEMLEELRKGDVVVPEPWLATKVWTTGKREGIAQMTTSMQRLVGRVELMQIHNLVDWKTQLATLRAWKTAGKIKYLGITHYGSLDQLEQVVRAEKLDFVQLPYSIVERGAEKRLLPACAEHGCAVLVMEPFAKGALFAKVKGKAVPGVASELGCTSWAQLFLKFLLAHPAVTCPIPATSKVPHVEDNLGAMRGTVPTAAQRDAIVAAFKR
ncbi:MAG: aldo/keto reductase [Deltaproteobacteria bacterium]|nr:aldo/keto reductase [Deltaproteobacteria bacterium]